MENWRNNDDFYKFVLDKREGGDTEKEGRNEDFKQLF